MDRRRFLAAAAGTATVTVTGCLGSDGYDTLSVGGESVPLAPTEDAYEWYQEEDVAVLDARSRAAWERTRIEGAVWSPAPDGRDGSDPAEEFSADRRILTYCACPHALSSQRAAALIADGYTDVYALDEGIRHWIDQGYPIAGDNVSQDLPTYEIRGRADPDAAGEDVWVREPETNQREVATIDAGGEYAVTFHFVEVTEETPLVLDTPGYEFRAPLGKLTDTVVTGPVE